MKIRGISYIIVPLAQLMPILFKGILVHNLISFRKYQNRFFKFQNLINVYSKNIFHQLFGIHLVNEAYKIGCFSKHEFSTIIRNYQNLEQDRFFRIYLRPYNFNKRIINQNKKNLSHDYLNLSPNDFIFLVWSRIEPENKGILKLIDCVKKHTDYFQENNVKIIVCGRDDNNRSKDILSQISKSIENTFLLVDPDKIDFDSWLIYDLANVITQISIWDGYPRTLRECIMNRKLMLVSDDTHFADIIKKYNLGASLNTVSNQKFNELYL